MEKLSLVRIPDTPEELTARMEAMRERSLKANSQEPTGKARSGGKPSLRKPNASTETIAALLQRSGLEPHERILSLEKLRDYKHQRQARTICRKMRDDIADALAAIALPDWWITLESGETGTGKSHLAMALVADVCRLGLPALFLPEVRMMELLRASYRPSSDFGAAQLRNDWMRPYLLVLDDLTADKATDASARDLYVLIEGRRRKRRPTVVTTNKNVDALAIHYGVDQGRRIASRIYGMCRGGATWIKMEGPDLRLKGEA